MILRFTNELGLIYTFEDGSQAVDAIVHAVEGAGASGVDTHLIEKAFREGMAYVRRRSTPRILTIPFNLLGETQEYWDARREMAQKLSPALGLGVLEFQPDGADQIYRIDASVVQLALPYTNRDFLRDGAVQFEAPFPFWRGQTEQSQTINVDDGVSSAIDTIDVSGGDVPTAPTVTIGEALAQTVTDPFWENQTHGGSMATSGLSVNSNQHLVANHLLSTLELETGASRINTLALTSRFWDLRLGEQTVRCGRTGTSGTLDFVFEWWELFSGI